MAVNYAEKYASQIDERFKLGALSTPVVNNDFDFIGVQTVKVYSVPTSKMNNYTLEGSSRYGTPEELGNEVQEMTLSQDRSFTFTIDRRNYDDTMMVNSAGMALQRQLDEVVIPEIDTYRFGKIVAGAGTTSTEAAITAENAYAAFLDGTMVLTDKKAPLQGRVAYVSTNFYKCIMQDKAFIRSSDLGQKMLIKGQVGEIDGVPIVVIPTSYMPENTEFFITHPIATPAPVKLAEYKIHDNPPGINGWLVEGRVYYDAFILNNKKDAIYVHKTPGE